MRFLSHELWYSQRFEKPPLWPKSSATQWVKTKMAHDCLSGYWFTSAGRRTLLESHTLGWEAVQGVGICMRAVKRLYFQITWRARPLTWPKVAMRRVKEGRLYTIQGSAQQPCSSQLTLEGVQGRTRSEGKVAITQVIFKCKVQLIVP